MREPRLADPGGADDGHGTALLLGLDGGEHAAQLAELTRAPDERARVRPGGIGAQLHEPPRAVERLGLHGVADQPVHGATEQDLAVRGRVLEPGGDRERAARGEPRAARPGADEHLTGLDTELQRELELGPGGAHLDRGADRSQGVVLAYLRLAEDAHDRVAGVALDAAAVALDHRAAGVGVAIEQLMHGLRVEPFGQRARAGDVGDDDAHQPARRRRLGRRRRFLGDRDGRRGHGQRRVLREDRALELAQPVTRLDPQLLDELAAGVLVDLQRVGLAVAAVEGEHELRAQVLAVGIGVDQRLELADHLGMAAERELRADELLVRRDAQILEARDLALRERLIRQVLERTAAPDLERFLEDRRRL